MQTSIGQAVKDVGADALLRLAQAATLESLRETTRGVAKLARAYDRRTLTPRNRAERRAATRATKR